MRISRDGLKVMSHEALTWWMRSLTRYVRSNEPDLTNRQMALMFIIYKTEGPHTVRTLSVPLLAPKPNISRLLTSLAMLSFVKREPDRTDRRNVFFVKTDKGRAFLARFEEMIMASVPVKVAA